MFHVELRQFPHVSRTFNLSREELEGRILVPWLSGRGVELDERRFTPPKARLTVYEGPELGTPEMGLGRGWANVTRGGEDVTRRVLEEVRSAGDPALEEFVAQVEERAGDGGLSLSDVFALARERHPDWQQRELAALTDQAVWSLLRGGRLRIVRQP